MLLTGPLGVPRGFGEDVRAMEGQGVAASSSAAAGRQGKPGSGRVAAAGLGYPADDSHVMISSDHPEASSQDDSAPPSPDSAGKPSQESQTEFPAQQIKSDKVDNIGDPDRNNGVVARDENTGQNQTAADFAAPAVD